MFPDRHLGLDLPDNQQICEFFFVVRDNDPTNDATAELLRKDFSANADPFAPPEVLASLGTTGASTQFQHKKKRRVKNRLIKRERFGYAVKVHLPENNGIETVRLGVEVLPTCP